MKGGRYLTGSEWWEEMSHTFFIGPLSYDSWLGSITTISCSEHGPHSQWFVSKGQWLWTLEESSTCSLAINPFFFNCYASKV